MDAGRMTLSGPSAPVVAQTGAIPDTNQKPLSTREKRERESRCATPTQSTPRMYREQGKGNARDTDRDSNARILIYMCIYKRVIQLRLPTGLNPKQTRRHNTHDDEEEDEE